MCRVLLLGVVGVLTLSPARADSMAPPQHQEQEAIQAQPQRQSTPLEEAPSDKILLQPRRPLLRRPQEANPAPAFSKQALRDIAHRLMVNFPLPKGRIVITKSTRRLDLYNGDTLLKSYGVALGGNPVGDKTRRGDSRTPEGRFFICTRNSKTSAFHIFLGLSYPAVPDAKRAVNNKQISWREYALIRRKLASRSAPLWGTRLGGWIGIHGGTKASFAQKKMRQRDSSDWTAGCIALTNSEIEELYAATKMGTPVDVLP